MADHLRQAHGLSSKERQPLLQQARHQLSNVERQPFLNRAVLSQVPLIVQNDLLMEQPESSPRLPRYPVMPPLTSLDIQPYPEFQFQHPFSMMVVGPSQSGKTHFVHQLLTSHRIAYPDKKPVRVCWCYNQRQPIYDKIQRQLKNKIRFDQGLPELEEDLSDISTKFHTIIVMDDLMAEANDSPVISKLFTQGRHRNASVILLLQNMFPKGKYNTDISRNALYKVLFRSPGDRKQIDIMAQQTFAKDRPRFMQAYSQETKQPYGYIVVDNHPRTTSEHQVVGNVFGDCYTYPHITSTSTPPQRVEPLAERELPVTTTRKRQAPMIQMPEVFITKHKTTPVKKESKQLLLSRKSYQEKHESNQSICLKKKKKKSQMKKILLNRVGYPTQTMRRPLKRRNNVTQTMKNKILLNRGGAILSIFSDHRHRVKLA